MAFLSRLPRLPAACLDDCLGKFDAQPSPIGEKVPRAARRKRALDFERRSATFTFYIPVAQRGGLSERGGRYRRRLAVNYSGQRRGSANGDSSGTVSQREEENTEKILSIHLVLGVTSSTAAVNPEGDRLGPLSESHRSIRSSLVSIGIADRTGRAGSFSRLSRAGRANGAPV